jgi:hypothetical protein
MKEILDFRECIFLLDKLPSYYKNLNTDFSNDFNYKNDNGNIKYPKKDVLIVKDIPRYLNVKQQILPKNIKVFNLEQYSGFMIGFKEVESIDAYLKVRFGNSSRYKLRRSIKKLETSFNISYKMYHGDISKQEYDFIFEEFFKLLYIRSIEKGISNNFQIKRKNFYYKLVYPLILKRKASFFVIFNGKNPIDVCLNFHNKNFVYQLIRTYDINYSKFNTGYIDLIKQIEWCVDNKISFINFSYGDYYWKRRWCNTVYKYDYNIFYNSKSIKSMTKAILYITEFKIRHVLREKGIIDKYHRLKSKIKNKFNSTKKIEIEIWNIDFNKEISIETEIDLYENNYDFLRRSIYEFLYDFNEKEKDLRVYKLINISNDYLVVGKENKIIIRIK